MSFAIPRDFSADASGIVRVPVTYQSRSHVRHEGIKWFTYSRSQWDAWSQDQRHEAVLEDWRYWLNLDIEAEIRFDLAEEA